MTQGSLDQMPVWQDGKFDFVTSLALTWLQRGVNRRTVISDRDSIDQP